MLHIFILIIFFLNLLKKDLQGIILVIFNMLYICDRPRGKGPLSLVHKVTVLPALRFGGHRSLRFVRSGHSVYVHNVTYVLTCDPILR